MKKIISILGMVGMLAFTQCTETETLRTIEGKEYQVEEILQIFTDSIEVKTANEGILIFPYSKIDTVYSSKIHQAWTNEKLMRFY